MMTTDPHPGEPAATELPAEDADAAELGEITLKDGPGGLRRKRFVGRFLAEAREVAKTGIEVDRVYRSRKGKFVIQRQRSDWSDFSTLTNFAADWTNWRGILGVGEQNWGDFTVEIVETLEDLRVAVAPKLYRRVVAATERLQTEVLDI
ncbi:EXLDI protein [Nocardia blacklockiae]|uniref:EXLDI protein n=1 Tax=Nocardia blacklockiae TaxID=480036 RepID=UPI0018943997|nr:EXLDI protein [Nocardia blacklockiae]MBF6171479.1 EXLDI protein [Nocardia blacklockiae]